jgi:hypothetical protein
LFDVQGKLMGIHSSMSADRLRKRRVPGDLLAWIKSLCNRRKASVVVGDYESPILEIEHVGGSIGFTDDYNALAMGSSALKNTSKLQTQLLSCVENWARESGAVFRGRQVRFIQFCSAAADRSRTVELFVVWQQDDCAMKKYEDLRR